MISQLIIKAISSSLTHVLKRPSLLVMHIKETHNVLRSSIYFSWGHFIGVDISIAKLGFF